MLQAQVYPAAARRLRRYAEVMERYARAATPRERAQLTRAINGLAIYARYFAERHNRAGGAA